MIGSASKYTCLLLCIQFIMGNNAQDDIDARKLMLSFYHQCDSSPEAISCTIYDIDCIENNYNRITIAETRSLTVFVPGYNTTNTSIIVQYIVSAYCSNNSAIILLDWSELSQDDYLVVANKVPKIARTVALILSIIKSKQYYVENWHLIAHSMGAHIAGCIGSYVNFTFKHVTDILYTDEYDTFDKIDIVNFYANIGIALQPGCYVLDVENAYNNSEFTVSRSPRTLFAASTLFLLFLSLSDFTYYIHSALWICSYLCTKFKPTSCSHVKAVQWYAETVRNKTKYPANRCKSCSVHSRDYRRKTDQIYLEPNVDQNARGTYRVATE